MKPEIESAIEARAKLIDEEQAPAPLLLQVQELSMRIAQEYKVPCVDANDYALKCLQDQFNRKIAAIKKKLST